MLSERVCRHCVCGDEAESGRKAAGGAAACCGRDSVPFGRIRGHRVGFFFSRFECAHTQSARTLVTTGAHLATQLHSLMACVSFILVSRSVCQFSIPRIHTGKIIKGRCFFFGWSSSAKESGSVFLSVRVHVCVCSSPPSECLFYISRKSKLSMFIK